MGYIGLDIFVGVRFFVNVFCVIFLHKAAFCGSMSVALYKYSRF